MKMDLNRLIEEIVPDAAEREALPQPKSMEILGSLLKRMNKLQRDVLGALISGERLYELSDRHDVSTERMRQRQVEARFQLHLCLTAPWLTEFRYNVFNKIDTTKTLPENTFVLYQEIVAGKELGAYQRDCILALAREWYTGAEIAHETKYDRHTINYALKTAGFHTDIQDTEWREIYRIYEGNALRAGNE